MNGLTLSIPADAYHADDINQERPSLSASIAHILITHSPAHARAAHPKLNPAFERKTEEKFDVGNACHALFLEGGDAVEIVNADDWRTAAAKEARQLARDYGRIPLLAKQYDEVQTMCDALVQQGLARDDDPPLFRDGKAEQTIVWEDNGVLCRARLDWLRDDLRAIDDLKTTSRSANPETWTRTLFGMGADIQAVMYQRAVCAAFDRIVPPEFRWCVVETTPPYALSVVSLAPSAIELANDKVDKALAIWKGCLESGEWPAYSSRIAYAEAPGWEVSRWLEREAREEMAA